MNIAAAPEHNTDLIDTLVGLTPGGATHLLRHRRDKVALATQGSYDSLFDPALPGLSSAERLLVAMYACRLSKANNLSAHYRNRIEALPLELRPDAQALGVAEAGESGEAGESAHPLHCADARLHAMLVFTRTLILRPIEGDKAALLALTRAGISTPAVVTLAQLIAFLSYQIRLVASLSAMQSAQNRRQPESNA